MYRTQKFSNRVYKVRRNGKIVGTFTKKQSVPIVTPTLSGHDMVNYGPAWVGTIEGEEHTFYHLKKLKSYLHKLNKTEPAKVGKEKEEDVDHA